MSDDIHKTADNVEGKIGGFYLRLWWATCEVHAQQCDSKSCILCKMFEEFKRIHETRLKA